MTDNESCNSSTGSLQEIDDFLTDVENGLMGNGRRGGGRAFFDSVNSVLASLRQRLERHQSTRADTQRPSQEQASSNLSERLHATEFAHSNRIPLAVLRSSHFVQVQTTAGGASSVLSFRQIVHITVSQVDITEKDDEEQGDQHEQNDDVASAHSSPSRITRRQSSLVASRLQLDELNNDDMDLHEEREMALLAGLDDQRSAENKDASPVVGLQDFFVILMLPVAIEIRWH